MYFISKYYRIFAEYTLTDTSNFAGVCYDYGMTFFLTFVAIVQSISISLGVGSSTLAILNFFAAIADGTIDETERRMMGIVYVVLRVAMWAILTSTLLLVSVEYSAVGLMGISAFTFAQLFTLKILFINATLMTAHLMPSTYGPAIQAGSWYTLGGLLAMQLQGVVNFTFVQFFLAYIAWIVLAIGIVNGAMAIQKARKAARN